MYRIKISFITLITLLFSASLSAKNFTTEVRVGYFYPSNNLIREIYKAGNFEFEAEGSYRIYKNISLWLNASIFVANGHSVGLHNQTNLQLYPLSAGLKYTFSPDKKISPYIGLGANYTFATVHDKTPFTQGSIHKKGGGIVAKSGMFLKISECSYLDLFTDYSYTNIASAIGSINLGGFRGGIGLGICY